MHTGLSDTFYPPPLFFCCTKGFFLKAEISEAGVKGLKSGSSFLTHGIYSVSGN